ncbi:protein ZBED8-like [Penaeus monodon]|uniref:protein ZBED8-like n=1 Tax=Penaeus monodon TaxID=6687 RepID=UPI0018A7B00E|nr:protein ZBED8-like [Penaeus monodon]
MSKKRKWNDDYVGFTCNGKIEDLQKPQCMLCGTVFSNANLKPSKLQEHFNNRHEELIKPCVLEMATTVLGNEARKKLELVPLSNNVIKSRIDDLSLDSLVQVISHMNASPLKISLQLDETTDVSNCSQLIALVVKDFFAKYELDLQIISSVCTDGAPAMLGNKSVFFSLMKQEIPHLLGTHCFLHRHALPPKLMKVLDTYVKTINWIRGRALNHCLFKSLCEDLGSEHTVLLFHTEVHWLSCGRVLTCFFELREEIKVFLEESHCDLLEELESQEFTQISAYLSDIFIQIVDDNESSSLIPSVCGEIVAHLEMLTTSFDRYFDVGKLESSKEWIMK